MYDETMYYVMFLTIEGFALFVVAFASKYAFGIVGANIICNMRQVTYLSVLKKHIGWFDDRDHSPGIITNILSADI